MERQRFYPELLPQQKENVLVRVIAIDDNSLIKVALVEYDEMESMIPFASIGLKVGKHETIQSVLQGLGKVFVVQVTRIDAQTGYLDLDRRTVSEDTANKVLLNYQHNLNIASFANSIKHSLSMNLDEIYQKYIWAVSQQRDYFEKFTEMTEDKAILDKYLENKENKEVILQLIQQRFKQNPCQIYIDMKITSSFSLLGVEIIKKAIENMLSQFPMNGLAKDEKPLQVVIVSPPVYRAEMLVKNKKEGKEKMKLFFEKVKTEIERMGGKVSSEQGVLMQEGKKE